ncbi:MAG: DUF4386 domain-containing protein [Acidobacteria bacterium]|nr:MAG: DUF4386 domain-containing protein [Acidobacteriota bacterium]
MTRATNARIAGFTFLAYIAAGITSMVRFRRAASGEGVAAKLAGIAAHATDVGVLVVLGLVQCFSALVLGVTLYAITRDQDGDLALLGLVCRVGEGIIAALSIPAMLALFWLATASGAGAPDTAARHALAAYLLRDDVALTATFFAVGSTAFAYLLLRGRMIPVSLAWLGVVASAVLVVGLPLQLAGWLHGPIMSAMWLPMLAFEVPLGLWLLTRGVAANPDVSPISPSA